MPTRFPHVATEVRFHADSSEESRWFDVDRPGLWVFDTDCLPAASECRCSRHSHCVEHAEDQIGGWMASWLMVRSRWRYLGNDVNTPRTKRCIANSVQAGIDVRQGTPVIISLDGRAVGGGDLSTGELKTAN